MLDFLFGMAAGHLLTQKNDRGNTPERIYEQAQTKVLIDIVKTAAEIEKDDPSPEELRLQLKPLKMMFDSIDSSKIKSPEGKTVYQQVKDYFEAQLNSDLDLEAQVDPDEFRQQLHEPILKISFDGKNVSKNNFYETGWNRRGLFYCTGSCGALHLFVPEKTLEGPSGEQILHEFTGAEYVIASVCENEFAPLYLELLFEDNSQAPFVLQLTKTQVCPHLSREDDNTTDLECQIHVAPAGAVAAEFPLRIRFVGNLPYMKPWGQ